MSSLPSSSGATADIATFVPFRLLLPAPGPLVLRRLQQQVFWHLGQHLATRLQATRTDVYVTGSGQLAQLLRAARPSSEIHRDQGHDRHDYIIQANITKQGLLDPGRWQALGLGVE